MIINTGQRTDIPAFYTPWFLNRLKDGFVMARNPFHHSQVTCYALHPEVVDLICFCTKNPGPLLPYGDILSPFQQLWHVTITPYGKDIEPQVPDKKKIIEFFRTLSDRLGPSHLCWRYDPVLLWGNYDINYHIRAFSTLAEALEGYTYTCIFSFIDLYGKTLRNFPMARRVSHENQLFLVEKFVDIAGKHGMKLVSCLENPSFASLGVDTTGCLTKEKVEDLLGVSLKIPSYENRHVRKGCACLLGHDIGAYSSCTHFCRYCYANETRAAVMENRKQHNPFSPFLLGEAERRDEIKNARQESWIDRETSLF